MGILIQSNAFFYPSYRTWMFDTTTDVNEEKPSGSYEVEFDVTSLTSEIYLYRIITDKFVETRKMLLLK